MAKRPLPKRCCRLNGLSKKTESTNYRFAHCMCPAVSPDGRTMREKGKSVQELIGGQLTVDLRHDEDNRGHKKMSRSFKSCKPMPFREAVFAGELNGKVVGEPGLPRELGADPGSILPAAFG